MPKAIVTGAGGFTGSNLCRNLIEHGYEVKAMVHPDGSTEALHGLDLEIIHGDIARDDGLDQRHFHNIDTVFHIAALFRQERATREIFHNVNATGTQRVLRYATDAGVKRFVHCSTAGVHGRIDTNTPADENAPFRPGDWYQETKLEGEKIALEWGKNHNIGVTVIRPSAICGPGDQRFAKLFRSVKQRHFVMIGSGEHHYHFVYVDDLAKGFILGAEKPEAIGEVFIIAGPYSITMNKLIDQVCQSVQAPKPRFRIPAAPVLWAAHVCAGICKPLGISPPLYPRRLDFFTKHRSFDTTKARTKLGYVPQVTPEEAISRMGAWYQEHCP